MMELRIQKQPTTRFGIAAGVLFPPLARILLVIAVMGLLTSGGLNLFQTYKNRGLERDLAIEQKLNQDLTTQLDNCHQEIADQNQRIQDIQLQAEEDMNNLKEVNKSLSDLTRVQQTEITKMRNRPAPKTCDEALEFLRDNLNIFEGEK